MDDNILYTIERHPHGFIIPESFSLNLFSEATSIAGPNAMIDSGIANHYQACVCFGELSELDLWRKEIEDSLVSAEPFTRFIRGTQVGTSSMTIALALARTMYEEDEVKWRMHSSPDIPHDSADFGRCHYLLSLLPEWKTHLGEVAVKFPETKWALVAPMWSELTALYMANKRADVTAKLQAIK